MPTPGYQHADKGSELLKRYEQGMDDFSTGGVLRWVKGQGGHHVAFP